MTQGTAAGAFGGFPLSQVCVAGKTGTAQLFGKNATSVFASFAPCNDPTYVVLVMVPDSGYGADVAAPAVRQIWDGIYGLEGHKAAVPGGQVPSSPPRISSTGTITAPSGCVSSAVVPHQGEVMLGRSTSYTARGLTTPRPGVFSGRRPRSLLARAFARNSPLRHMDWLLIVVVLGLSAIGTLLVWSATQPGLLAAGADPRTYLKKQLLNVMIGLVLMVGVSLVDTRQLRTWVPLFYGATVLGLLAVLTPIGSVVNGAHAWFSLPGGFQVEPSEFAKVALILGIAMIFSQARPGTSGGPGVRSLLIALACAAPLIGLVVIDGPGRGPGTRRGDRHHDRAVRPAAARPRRARGPGGRDHRRGRRPAPAEVLPAPPVHLLPAPGRRPGQRRLQRGQAKIAVGSGGMFGQGLFHGRLVAGNFVPSQQTDFIFTVAGEELGFIGAIVIVFLLGVVIVRALRIATRADDLFGLLVASGSRCGSRSSRS